MCILNLTFFFFGNIHNLSSWVEIRSYQHMAESFQLKIYRGVGIVIDHSFPCSVLISINVTLL